MHTTCKVLVVDDEPDIRQILCDRVTSAGFHVETAAPEEARRITAMEPLCVILLGLEPDGLALLDHLHLTDPTVPIIALSTRRVGRESLAHGAHLYFSKPIDLEGLMAAVRRIFIHGGVSL